MKRLFSLDSKCLVLVLKANLVLLVALMVIALFFPLSSAEKSAVVMSTAVLAGFNWALIAHGKKK